MSERFVVEGLAGEKRLRGELAVGGAKNAILKSMPAAILLKTLSRSPMSPISRMSPASANCSGTWGLMSSARATPASYGLPPYRQRTLTTP